MKKENIPRVRHQGKPYQIIDVAFNSVKITDGKDTFIVGRDKVKPTNKEARELLK